MTSPVKIRLRVFVTNTGKFRAEFDRKVAGLVVAKTVSGQCTIGGSSWDNDTDPDLTPELRERICVKCRKILDVLEAEYRGAFIPPEIEKTMPPGEYVTLKKQFEGAVAQCNASCPVGTPVSVMMDDGTTVESKVTHEATILGGHTAMGWFEGISGCYKLDRARKL